MTSAKILFVYLRYRLQNIPYFCVFKYARAVKQNVGNEAENRERDWGDFLRHALPISLLILRKKTDCFAVYLRRGKTVMEEGRS